MKCRRVLLQYVPPVNYWEPPQENEGWQSRMPAWEPAPPPDILVTSEPSSAPPRAQGPPPDPMQILIDMGFANREMNRKLLAKHGGNIDPVIVELLQDSGADWPILRH